MERPILVGAVLYDPKVRVIWDIIRDFFAENRCPIDAVFYTNYELMVQTLVQGHIDIAWNSPLAWLDAERQLGGACRAIAMRDTDRDRVSHIITKTQGGIGTIADLRGKRLAVGAKDSPQATLIPLRWLQRHGLEPGRDFQVRRFDVLVGKHGDHVGGELQALQCLAEGEAAASALLDLNWQGWIRDGTIDPHAYRILTTTPPFDHCCFTVRADFSSDREHQFVQVLFAMRYDDPKHRQMMDMEGLKAWVPGRTTGYALLQEAVTIQGMFEGSINDRAVTGMSDVHRPENRQPRRTP
jgi:phosphonate transport system substrate-binding protein